MSQEQQCESIGKDENDEILTCQLTPFISTLQNFLLSDLFDSTIKKEDILNLLQEETFTIKLTKQKFKEIDQWINITDDNITKDEKGKLNLLFVYRIALSLKLKIEPRYLQFVGIAHLNVPLSTVLFNYEINNFFFTMHPIKMNNYNASIILNQDSIKFVGSVNEDIVPFVIVFSVSSLHFNPVNSGVHFYMFNQNQQ
jgi:hypothetical protein